MVRDWEVRMVCWMELLRVTRMVPVMAQATKSVRASLRAESMVLP